MDDVEVRDLVIRAKSDPEAFGQLYQHYVDRIYNYHYRHTGNSTESEDLTSRTFYRALRSIHSYREKGASFQAWLFRIAHNLVINWYRDSGRHQSVSIDSVQPCILRWICLTSTSKLPKNANICCGSLRIYPRIVRRC